MSCYGEGVLPSIGELQPAGKPSVRRRAMTASGARTLPGASWLGALMVAAMIALVLLVQCVGAGHHNTTVAAPPHHAVAPGSPVQRSAAVIAPHDHLSAPVAAVCAAADVVVAQLSAPTAARVLWIAAVASLAWTAMIALAPVLMRGPPPHTRPAVVAAGATLIHRLCVLRR